MDFQLSEYHRDLIAATRELARGRFGARAFAQDDEAGLPREYLTFLAEHGLAGITMPQADGGQGGKLLDAVLVIETVAQICPVAGDCVQALNFGAIQQLARHGSPAIKQQHLTPCLCGEKLISIATISAGRPSPSSTAYQDRLSGASSYQVSVGSGSRVGGFERDLVAELLEAPD